MIRISDLVDLVADIARKRIAKHNIPGPLGVRGRDSDNALNRRCLDRHPPRRCGPA